jgi:hypothetical protein
MAALIAIIVIGMFAAGTVVGIIAIITLGIRREERDFSLTRRAPGRMSQGARSLTGLYVRQRSDSDPAAATVWQDMLV